MPIYFIQAGDGGPVKIGFTKDIARRLPALQTGHTEKLRLVRLLDGSMSDERRLHVRLAEYRVSGEWFALPQEILVGDHGHADLSMPQDEGDRRSGERSDDVREQLSERAYRRYENPAERDKQSQVGRRAGAITRVNSALKDAAYAVGRLSAAATPIQRLRAIRFLRAAEVKLTAIHAEFPTVLEMAAVRARRGDSGGGYAVAALERARECKTACDAYEAAE